MPKDKPVPEPIRQFACTGQHQIIMVFVPSQPRIPSVTLAQLPGDSKRTVGPQEIRLLQSFVKLSILPRPTQFCSVSRMETPTIVAHGAATSLALAQVVDGLEIGAQGVNRQNANGLLT